VAPVLGRDAFDEPPTGAEDVEANDRETPDEVACQPNTWTGQDEPGESSSPAPGTHPHSRRFWLEPRTRVWNPVKMLSVQIRNSIVERLSNMPRTEL
jgi:hypothetical protein